MALGAVADQRERTARGEIDADRNAAVEIGVVGIDQPLVRMQLAERLRVEQRVAVAEADLRQPRALAHQDRKGLRADLGIERAVIAGLDAVEAARLVGDHAGEDVEPAGRALRVGGGRDVGRQRQALDQRHDVDAAGLQHGAVGQRDLVQLELVDALGDRGARAGQEARAHAEGDGAEAQVEARRLDLAGHERLFGEDAAAFSERRNHAVRQDALGGGGETERHGIRPHLEEAANGFGLWPAR